MMRPPALLLLASALVGVMVLGGCTSLPARTQQGPQPVRTGVGADNTTVPLMKGQRLVVTLPANPSTGFTWEVAALPGHVAIEGTPTFASGASETSPALVGATGEMTFTFLVTDATNGALELAYRRPWEKKPAARTYRLTVAAK